MTVATPEFLQTKQYDAIKLRYLLQSFITEGVGGATDDQVTQRAAGANLSVDVAAGRAWVQGDDIARQGVYHVVNDATVNVTIPTPDPTNPRIDRVVLRVYDSTVGALSDNAALEIVQGTPTSGATLVNLNGAAAVPATALLLANVLVAAATSTITNAAIGNVAGQSTSTGAARSIPFFAARAAQAIWTNMPAALTELFGETTRQQYDLSGATQARLVCHVTTAANASGVLRGQYSTDGGTNWNYLDGATGPEAAIATTGMKISGWVNLAAGAKADVQLRVIGINGDGAADPAIPRVTLHVR